MQSKLSLSPELKNTIKKTKRFQQDFQAQDDPEVLQQFLTDSQIKEMQNKQRLYQIRRENEALKEQLSELEAQKKKLEVAKDVNQTFFKKNEQEIIALKRPLEDQSFFSDAINSSESQETLRKKIKEIIADNRKEVDGVIENLPNMEEILVSNDLALAKLLDLLKGQILIYSEEMVQKEKAYRNMQDRYMGEFEVLSDQHRTIRSKLNEVAHDKKADMLKKYSLERKIAYVEADVELGNGYVNAQKLALVAAQEVNKKIQKADTTKSLSALNSKIQRKIASAKAIQ